MHVPGAVAEFILNLGLPKMIVMGILYLFYMLLGCFMGPIPIMLMTMSAVLPVLTTLGFDLIWFGVVFAVLGEMAFMTPPVGAVIFVLQSISGEKIQTVYKSMLPFVIIMIIGLALVTVFPILVLWLPSIIIQA